MRSMVCEKPGLLRLELRPDPAFDADEVLLRIRRVGVCGTDLHIFGGTQPYLSYPRVMGHELAGTVVRAPAASGLAEGDPAFVIPYVSCGHCNACRAGKTNCCRSIAVLGVHRDGGMSELLSVPARLVRKAEGISLDQAAMVEFLAIGAHAARRAAITPGQTALVVGAGPIGIATALFAAADGARVAMLDGRRDRLAFAAAHLPVARTILAGPDDEQALSDFTAGDFFDVVFDATGNPRAMERGFGLVAHGGRYVLVSIVSGAISFSDPEFHKRETTLLGSRNATPEDFDTVLAAMRAGRIPTGALATHRLAFEEVPDRFAELSDPARGVVKALIELP